MEDIWIDADVPGPALPAGRISPELRGRASLRADGRIAPLPALGNGASGTGGGMFRAFSVDRFGTGGLPVSIRLADFDGDGIMDCAVTSAPRCE